MYNAAVCGMYLYLTPKFPKPITVGICIQYYTYCYNFIFPRVTYYSLYKLA